MKLMVPTVVCDVLVANALETNGRTYKVGEICTMAYGLALTLKAIGGITGIVNENEKHMEAQEQLRIYGGDCWFPHHQQSISRVADYLAETELRSQAIH